MLKYSLSVQICPTHPHFSFNTVCLHQDPVCSLFPCNYLRNLGLGWFVLIPVEFFTLWILLIISLRCYLMLLYVLLPPHIFCKVVVTATDLIILKNINTCPRILSRWFVNFHKEALNVWLSL